MRTRKTGATRVIGLGVLISLVVAIGLALPFLSSRQMGERERLALPSRATDSDVTRLAVIGDFGMDNQPEADVAALVASWQPDAVITTGDNNYPDGKAETIDANIGKHYQAFIYPYRGNYGAGASTNRFFPTLGNHDWHTTAGSPPLPQPYLDYFTLPGNERYYDVVIGPVHLFAIDSDPHEPDGIEERSAQADWLRNALAASTAPWRIVAMHHPPYSSSSRHGSTSSLQWPFAAWGATAVLAGHDHAYERIVQDEDDIVYFVNGIGGADRYPLSTPVADSQVRFDSDYGAMLIEATTSVITYTLVARTGVIYDTYSQSAADFPHPAAPLVSGIEARVVGSENDAEESLTTHAVTLKSSDLEMTGDLDDPGRQVVGMRFTGVNIPQGMTIITPISGSQVDEAADERTSLIFAGEASDAPLPFQAAPGDLSKRERTAAHVAWDNIPAWSVVGLRWRTPYLTPIVQELVNRPGWQPGQSMVFLVEGSGRRTADSFDDSPATAPLLRIEIVLPEHVYLPATLRN
ncbi:MAG: metallophosphoesterase [Anaerolineales bacterium]|nr:metallophosphoesterase [Anaerolineales bacterium]